ncbi:LysR family transcriptional regulator [Diaphorobacter caeni]|uniref:LysR family transcriptional regulator n=1 Tax=Diaphorobacter caeni TaxID=2784387 RepID=UPI0018900077|nr:LysR family transcriptional regulator [Diaphorobacter caeni]MBF5005387.1 LysR family transcriptional regulator [Diaphorobacter caeni]
MRLDLSDLRLFLCVVDAGSITQGAARAHLALASASERLRSIEEDAGVQLLERRPRGVITTEAGEALAHHARRILQQQELLRSELSDFARGSRGTLVFYASTVALTEYLPRQLAPWLATRPRLRVDLKERTSTEISHGISSGLIEAGIVSDVVQTQGLDLQLQPLVKDHLVLIAPAEHRLAKEGRRSLAFNEVLGEQFVGLTSGSALQEHIAEHASRAGRDIALRIRMKTFGGVCEMVSHGIGVGILPIGVARRYRRQHPFRIIPLTDAWAQRHLCLCWRDWSRLSPSMRSLLTHLGATQ